MQVAWLLFFVAVVHSLSHVWLFVTPWTAAHKASLSFTTSLSLLKFMSFEQIILSNHLSLRHLLLLMPSILTSVRVFSNELALCIKQLKYWSFSFSNSGGGFVTKSCLALVTPWSVACQAPVYMGFSRQEYWSRLPFPSPEDLPAPGMKPGSRALQADSSPLQGITRCSIELPALHRKVLLVVSFIYSSLYLLIPNS